jgi:hypothetical protein
MTSLADLFNPSFFIILGIVVLLIALVVVYFESKLREQNHKIASMLSLVSTLAEEFNHLAIKSVNTTENVNSNTEIPQTHILSHNLESQHNETKQLQLIEVSDDETYNEDDVEDDVENDDVEDDDVEDDDVEDDDVEDDDENDVEDDDENDVEDDVEDVEKYLENIKIVKLNISEIVDSDATTYEEANNLVFDADTDLAILEDMNKIPQISEESIQSLTPDEVKEEIQDSLVIASNLDLSSLDLKNISADENSNESYKKLSLPKLRSIVVDKGLISNSDVQKLKKPEILKLLGVE